MALMKFVGKVSTNKVGSECDFEFTVDEDDLPTDPDKRARAIEEMAQEALWGSGSFDWSYAQVDN